MVHVFNEKHQRNICHVFNIKYLKFNSYWLRFFFNVFTLCIPSGKNKTILSWLTDSVNIVCFQNKRIISNENVVDCCAKRFAENPKGYRLSVLSEYGHFTSNSAKKYCCCPCWVYSLVDLPRQLFITQSLPGVFKTISKQKPLQRWIYYTTSADEYPDNHLLNLVNISSQSTFVHTSVLET